MQTIYHQYPATISFGFKSMFPDTRIANIWGCQRFLTTAATWPRVSRNALKHFGGQNRFFDWLPYPKKRVGGFLRLWGSPGPGLPGSGLNPPEQPRIRPPKPAPGIRSEPSIGAKRTGEEGSDAPGAARWFGEAKRNTCRNVCFLVWGGVRGKKERYVCVFCLGGFTERRHTPKRKRKRERERERKKEKPFRAVPGPEPQALPSNGSGQERLPHESNNHGLGVSQHWDR